MDCFLYAGNEGKVCIFIMAFFFPDRFTHSLEKNYISLPNSSLLLNLNLKSQLAKPFKCYFAQEGQT